VLIRCENALRLPQHIHILVFLQNQRHVSPNRLRKQPLGFSRHDIALPEESLLFGLLSNQLNPRRRLGHKCGKIQIPDLSPE
jgi:hypothetical protein